MVNVIHSGQSHDLGISTYTLKCVICLKRGCQAV